MDYNTGALQLSYWVDYWLGQMFPTSAGATLLQFTSTDDVEIETLPVTNANGTVVIMIANHALNAVSDNNGPGAARAVTVDVSALGSFSSASLLTIDRNTNVTSGPVATTITPASKVTITFAGYGVAFLSLAP